MTEFERRGHWRTSKYGLRYWVSGHTVERYDWERPGYYSYARERLNELSASYSYSSCFVNPNATCPICGEPVFFYQNEYGSRVFFDELGPPWPKHPCTDNANYNKRRFSSPRKPKSPSLRESGLVREIYELWSDEDLNLEEDFNEKYSSRPWPAYVVERKFKVYDRMLLAASSLDPGKTKLLYLLLERYPVKLKEESTFFYKRGQVEFLNPKSLKPVAVAAEKLSGAAGFVTKLVGHED